MPGKKKGANKAARNRNPRWIYDYAPDGVPEGKQVRFKRQRDGQVETTSMYFSIARYGSMAASLAAAKRWLVQNKQWMDNRRFKPKTPRHPDLRLHGSSSSVSSKRHAA